MSASVRHRRSSAEVSVLVAAAMLAAIGLLIATARPAAACSCAGWQSMKEYATPDNAVFTGTAGLLQDRGVPVEVGRWLWGAEPAPIVWLAAASFGDSSSCGTTTPPPDSQWIWVGWRDGGGGDYLTGLCSPAAMLGTPEGDAMLDDAIGAFGGPSPPDPTIEPTPEAPAPATAAAATAAPATAAPTTAAPAGPVPPARDTTGLLVGGGVVLASLALFGGLALVARRGGRDAP